MRGMKRLLSALLFALLAFSITVPAKAADYQDTYTVRIYAGRQGVMTGCAGNGEIAADGRMFVFQGLRYGSRINVSFREKNPAEGGVPADGYNQFVMTVREDGTDNVSEVTFEVESKYYIMGTRESGKDNSERIGSIMVEGDRDYVAAYGLMKDSVEYTIHYLDTEGNVLRESEKYRGTIGDKPVVAYQYVDGYQPQAYNLTKTLSANAAENVFTFVYSLVTAPVNVVTVPGQPGEPGVVEPDQGVVNVIPGEEGPVVPGPEVPGPGEDEPGGVDLPDDPVPQGEGPEEMVDLDDEQLPLNQYKDGKKENGIIGILSGNAFLLNVSTPVKILILCAFAVLIGGGIWWLVKCAGKKKNKEDEESKQSSEGAS